MANPGRRLNPAPPKLLGCRPIDGPPISAPAVYRLTLSPCTSLSETAALSQLSEVVGEGAKQNLATTPPGCCRGSCTVTSAPWHRPRSRQHIAYVGGGGWGSWGIRQQSTGRWRAWRSGPDEFRASSWIRASAEIVPLPAAGPPRVAVLSTSAAIWVSWEARGRSGQTLMTVSPGTSS